MILHAGGLFLSIYDSPVASSNFHKNVKFELFLGFSWMLHRICQPWTLLETPFPAVRRLPDPATPAWNLNFRPLRNAERRTLSKSKFGNVLGETCEDMIGCLGKGCSLLLEPWWSLKAVGELMSSQASLAESPAGLLDALLQVIKYS